MFLILRSKLTIGHWKWFLNTNLFLIKLFLITKFDCTKRIRKFRFWISISCLLQKNRIQKTSIPTNVWPSLFCQGFRTLFSKTIPNFVIKKLQPFPWSLFTFIINLKLKLILYPFPGIFTTSITIVSVVIWKWYLRYRVLTVIYAKMIVNISIHCLLLLRRTPWGAFSALKWKF